MGKTGSPGERVKRRKGRKDSKMGRGTLSCIVFSFNTPSKVPSGKEKKRGKEVPRGFLQQNSTFCSRVWNPGNQWEEDRKEGRQKCSSHAPSIDK